MRILGIDPGSSATGYGVVERAAGGLVHVAHGTLRPPRTATLAQRLAHLHGAIADVVATHRPDVAAVEQIFVAGSPRSALVLGQARGAVLAAVASAGVAINECAASDIKKCLAGSGRASKRQVQLMVRRHLGLDRTPASDSADALAAAIFHAHSTRLDSLGVGRGRRRRPQRSVAMRVRRVP